VHLTLIFSAKAPLDCHRVLFRPSKSNLFPPMLPVETASLSLEILLQAFKVNWIRTRTAAEIPQDSEKRIVHEVRTKK
jgi:hypothetical protein